MPGFERIEPRVRSIALSAGVTEVAFEAEFRWEFGEAVCDVHFDAVVFTAALVRRAEGATIGGAGEGEEFVEAVAEAAHGAVGAIDSAVGPAGFAAVGVCLANDLLGDFDESVEDVADGPAEFAGSGVLGSGRCLDVRCGEAGEDGENGSDDSEFFHAGRRLEGRAGAWQRDFCGIVAFAAGGGGGLVEGLPIGGMGVYFLERTMERRRAFQVWLGLLAACAPGLLMAEELPRVPRFHDPSTPVLVGDSWWIFATGTGVVSRVSERLEGPWREGPPVFKEMPAWHREIVPDHKGHLWAPEVLRLGGRYWVYYSVSSWGSNRSAIGLASNETLDPADPKFGWKDEGVVIESKREDAYNAIDPHVLADDDGRLWMSFGSFWSGIQLVELDAKTGKAHGERKEVHRLAWSREVEAPAILKRDGYYHLFVSRGLCCRGVKSTYEIRYGRSRNITGPYVDEDGVEMVTGGGSLLVKGEGFRIGPGHPAFFANQGRTFLSFHYYDARFDGRPSLGMGRLDFGESGWPKLTVD